MASSASRTIAASPNNLDLWMTIQYLRKPKRAAYSSSARNARICINLLSSGNFKRGPAAAALNVDKGESGGRTVHCFQTLSNVLQADARTRPRDRQRSFTLILFCEEPHTVIFNAEENRPAPPLRLHY